jgi:NADH-quinone oxidoreductase subunit E
MKKENDVFIFNAKNLSLLEEIFAKYPKDNKRSAILPLLDLAQRQNNGWLSRAVIEYISTIIDLPAIRVYEVASFYSMFNLKPVGKYHIQICGTTPCWLRGADNIKTICESALAIKVGETTQDGKFTLSEVECLGACTRAPVIQINDDYYEDLNEEKIKDIITQLSIS